MKKTGALLLFLLIFFSPVEGAEDIAIIVNKENPITEISRSELIKIYLGKKALFDNGVKIVPLDLWDKNRLKSVFYEKVLGKNVNKIKSYWIKRIFSGHGSPPEVFRKAREIKKFVADNEGAIGYVGLLDLDDRVKAVRVIQ